MLIKRNNKVKKKREQHELLKVRRPCIALLRKLIKFNQLKRYPFIYWSCPPDVGYLLPAKRTSYTLNGYEKGVYDLTIVAGNETTLKVWLIEFKYDKGDYTKEQKAIAEKSKKIKDIEALKIKSINDFNKFILDYLK
jgi:hypothetical protein